MVLRASDAILARNLRLIRRNLALLTAFVERHADLFEWVPPTAGAIAFIKFKGPLSSSELGAELAAAGIGMKPAYCFADVVTPDIDYFRVGFGEAALPRSLEALERFARREAEKAIKRVLARSPAAVAARQAKERPKKKRARARQRASDAKIKTAKAKGTYKSRTSGDTKIHWKRAATHRDRKRRLKSAYNKVEKYGPGACTPDDIKKHAKHKKILEKTLATYHAARKEGKKRL